MVDAYLDLPGSAHTAVHADRGTLLYIGLLCRYRLSGCRPILSYFCFARSNL
jgi:hypothetical protein